MTDKRIVLNTTGSKEEAEKIARALVETRLAACVNILGPIESTYRWQRKVENSAEYLLVIKTTAKAFPRVRDAIRKLHSYELPECVELTVTDGSAEYLKWLDRNVK
jgi:periplasmic divalent cation tolerance protein